MRQWPGVLCVALLTSTAARPQAPLVVLPEPLVVDERVLPRQGPVTAWAGGFGSAMALHPHRPAHVYLLADRGPNTGTGRDDEKRFLRPAHAPRIGLFRPDGLRLRRVREIVLRD